MIADEFPFLVGRTVEQIWIWGPFRLIFELGDRPEPEIYVDADDGVYKTRDGTTSRIDVRNDPGEAGDLLRLLNQRVVAASAEAGVLSLSFENGAELRAYPDEQYESWSVIGDGTVYQCLPGGEVDSW